jgi:hypothetical protein
MKYTIILKRLLFELDKRKSLHGCIDIRNRELENRNKKNY